jgi:Putative porin
MKQFFFVTIFLIQYLFGQSQIPKGILRRGGNGNPTTNQNNARDTIGTGRNNANRKDTLGFVHRDDRKDSISISYKFLDSTKNNLLDTSINDFDNYFSVPSSYQYLGNNGAAAYNLIYTPFIKAGWDAGFHAFDVYKFKLAQTKFYKTNRPFTQMSYQLASGKEQLIKVFHTQNPRPNWNFGFNYRLISAPGFFVTQNTNHKNYSIFSTYQGKRKRYNLNFIVVGNSIKNSENGGIINDTLLQDKNRKKRFSIPVNLGNANGFAPNPFLTGVATGNIYKDVTLFLRQYYDLGKKDSLIINDSTTEYLFYPKLRLQHTFSLNSNNYLYQDTKADSSIYKKWYDTAFKKPIDSFSIQEKWTVIRNDFSLLQFPDKKNVAQFFLLGATLENIKGQFLKTTKNFYNIILHGEYRNKTKNKLWDVLAKGEFYLNGLNSGNYTAYATINRFLNKKLGSIQLFFNNVNRTPSYIFNAQSSFNFSKTTLTKNENILSFGGEAKNKLLQLSFKNNLITNYAYFNSFFKIAQYNKVINVLQISASKKIKITKKLSWYTDITLQQTDKSAPIKLPLVFTRNRLAIEGTFYKNLNLCTGIEVRYYTPYNAYNYSPALGQFTVQDTVQIKNLPDVSAFFHFKIKAFTGYLRTENLNTVSVSDGFGFTNNNFAAPHYPTQGLMIRFGIQWGFVN